MEHTNNFEENLNKPNASVGQRFKAQFCDQLVSLGLAILVYNFFTNIGLEKDLNIGLEKEVAVFWGIIAFIAYMLLSDGLPNGQSLGKKLTRTSCIEASTGIPCSFGRSFGRNIFLFLGFIDWIFLVGAEKKRLGDYVAKTRVIKTSDY